MTILLVGSTGFVGQHLLARLQRDGHKVVPYTRGMQLAPEVMEDTFGAVINCAGEITVPHRMVESNVMLTHSLLQFAQLAGIPKVIHVGSSSEYGKTDLPRCEDSGCVPACLYDGTKLAATALCQGFAAQFDMDVVVARPFSLYGPGDTPRKLIPRLYQAHLTGKLMDLGPGGHDWLYIDDFVDGLAFLLTAPRERTKGQVYNFGTGVSSSNLDVKTAMENAVAATIPVNYRANPLFVYDTDRWVADTSKTTALGWTAKHSLLDGIECYVEAERAAFRALGQQEGWL